MGGQKKVILINKEYPPKGYKFKTISITQAIDHYICLFFFHPEFLNAFSISITILNSVSYFMHAIFFGF